MASSPKILHLHVYIHVHVLITKVHSLPRVYLHFFTFFTVLKTASDACI